MFRLASALPSFRGGNTGDECQSKDSAIATVSVSAGEEADQVRPLSTITPTNPIQDTHWVTELNNSRVARHSRSSSIVSTQTRFTTTTLQEDARSIDINLGGGQVFRISRDGSRVTTDAPPPYTGPGEVVRFGGGRASGATSVDSRTNTDHEAEDDDDDETEDGATTPRSTFIHLDTDQGVRATILDPTEFEMPSPVDDNSLNRRSSTATLVQRTQADGSDTARGSGGSFEQGRDILSTPRRNGQGRRAASQDATSTLQHPMQHSSLRRTNGVRLPRLITSSEIPRATHRPQGAREVSSWGRPLEVRSAGAILNGMPTQREPISPDYIGRNARGAFPIPTRISTSQIIPARGSPMRNASTLEEEISTPNNSLTPLAMDDENDISLHYARMMRNLDAAHRKALLTSQKSISKLHEKLNEKDIVLRQQLRAKDFIIDDLKARLANLEDTVETLVEKARHEVEDLWETRWKDRDFHLRDRMRRIEEEAQKRVDGMRMGMGRVGAVPMSPL